MHRIVFGVDRIFARYDFFAQELFSGSGEHALLIADVFRGEYILGRAVFNQEAAAFRRRRLFRLAGHMSSCCREGMTIPLRLSRGNFSTVCSSRDAEVKEVLLQRLDWRSKHVVAVEDVAHLFAQPKEFPESAGCSPPRVLDR